MGYLANFIVYTLAMVGVMMLALFIFKKSMNIENKGCAKHLKVLDTMSLGPRKTLYIISAGDEKFLIAGDAERTNLISKLETKTKTPEINFKETMKESSYMDKSIVGIRSSNNTPYTSVIKSLAEKIKEG